jgi:3-oxoacyl-(acyl-carrier-protein) synthase
VKANIGHLEGTAGVAGLIKSILVLERGVIPPVANLEVVNREIDAQHLNLKVFSHRAARMRMSAVDLLTSHPVSPKSHSLAKQRTTQSFGKLFWIWRYQLSCRTG